MQAMPILVVKFMSRVYKGNNGRMGMLNLNFALLHYITSNENQVHIFF